MASAKKSAQQLLEQLPGDADWDDIMSELYVKQNIEPGQQAAAESRPIVHTEVRRRLLS